MQLLKYIGNKNFLLNKLLPLPKHTTYVEIFGGTGSVLLNKIPSKFEIYNDINTLLVNFYQVIKNNYEKLKNSLQYEILSKSIFEQYKKDLHTTEDPIKKAMIFFYLNRLCFAGKISKSIDSIGHRGFAYNRTETNPYFEKLLQFETVHNRISHVDFYNVDYHTIFQKLLKTFDKEGTLIYVDPPYSTKTKYGFGFSNEVDLVNVIEYCNSFKNAGVIFSYDKNILPKWRVKKFQKSSALNNKNHRVLQNEYVFYNDNCDVSVMTEHVDILDF